MEVQRHGRYLSLESGDGGRKNNVVLVNREEARREELIGLS